MGRRYPSPDLLPGRLDLPILRSLAGEPMQGYGIFRRLRQVSDGVLQGPSENNLRATFYSSPSVGRWQLARERQKFERSAGAIFKVLETA